MNKFTLEDIIEFTNASFYRIKAMSKELNDKSNVIRKLDDIFRDKKNIQETVYKISEKGNKTKKIDYFLIKIPADFYDEILSTTGWAENDIWSEIDRQDIV